MPIKSFSPEILLQLKTLKTIESKEEGTLVE